MKNSEWKGFFMEEEDSHSPTADHERFVVGFKSWEFGWVYTAYHASNKIVENFVFVLPFYRYESHNLNNMRVSNYLYIGPFSCRWGYPPTGDWAYWGKKRLW